MKASAPPSTAPSRRSHRIVAAVLIAFVLGSGCASYVPKGQLAAFEPHSETIALWARNPIVCAPTALGNAAGALAGVPLAIVTALPAWIAAWSSGDDDLAYRIYGTAYWAPILLGGAAVGSVFLPFSYAMGKDLCYLGVSGGWQEPADAAQ